MKGRKPVPTALKVLRGNPGKRALPKNEPQAPAVDPLADPPAHMTEAGKAEWREWAPKLCAAGVLTELDVLACEQLCETTALLKVARVGGEARDVLRLQDEQRRLLVEFGMTPSSRTRVSKASAPKKEGNRFTVIG